MLKFPIGDAIVTQLTELDVWPIAPRLWYPDVSDDQLDCAQRLFAPSAVTGNADTLLFAIHNYIVEIDDTVIVVDTCSGNHKNRPYFPDLHMLDTDYLNRLARAGFDPTDVDIVVNTHLHLDHCGWNTRFVDGKWVPTFPNATYLFQQAELEHLRAQWNSASVGQWPHDAGWVYQDSVLPILQSSSYRVAAANTDIHTSGSTRVRALEAAGHTVGHLAIEVTSPGGGLLIVGDALHHPMQALYPDLVFYADHAPQRAISTRRALLERSANEGLGLVTAHFPTHAPLHVRTNGDSFEWQNYVEAISAGV
ncbi:MBL fold metallo-hydrolase [Mycobacterium sp. CBMA293]|uniref:MBL fold metallo-hydrolase n=1 Tax=unclassified Mycolicibacterium TaxID=2636767 RepID=UPI001327FC9E|nr:MULTISPECIES: MBL fold metallo-hydrolase [unclassified Mycolicibacterium]MUL47080.1 MBL fold metallo-hydrolase [Mycolicibacterium sp. CBMA 360]MUL93340.1 MBL fold metallo-hydrolase [Mycolicibacterium sp. CBMA 230]MUM35391.1 MBL fold metallo-hydrolase [Mycolicibacterium sp. CBMA 361]MUL58457.1 MBL fold metallo-hydrolase [Mycolicibacterium sp. CBMA 335]MUL73915.1 MBL fold metallo-hydrolase [Mycolicibacterium sp. CBMA 311]